MTKFLPFIIMSAFATQSVLAMTELSDKQLANATGQSLFNLSYIAPSQSGNPSNNVGFYKLGFDAQLDLNANIRNLRLGCDTATSTDTACDVDIDGLRFTGIVPTIGAAANDAGPASDFTLKNPFIEFAIRNPTTASTREFVGLRFGASEAWGLMSFGQDPATGANDPANHTGINSLSGHLPIIVTRGTVPTTICTFAANDPTGCGSGGQVSSTNSTINQDVPNAGDNFFDQIVSRQSSVQLNNIKVKSLLNLTINANLDQNLKFIHNIKIGDDANGDGKYQNGEGINNFAISVQKENISWNNNSTWLTANKGWFLELPKFEIADFTTRRVYTTLGAVFGLNLKDLNQNQKPVDNCYGTLSFC